MRPLIVILSSILLLLTGCDKTPEKYVIGVSQCSEDYWRDKFNAELRTAAMISDSLTVHIMSASDNDQRQTAQINQLIDQGVDLLIVSPNTMKSASAAIDRAYNAGIPVILYDRKMDSKSYTAFIGCDNYLVGNAMGQYITQRLNGKGRVAEITGLKGSSPAVERHRGFVDALKESPGVEIVAMADGDWKEASGEKAMRRILSMTEDFDYVFCHNDRMATGARKAALAAGHDKYLYTGVDGLANNGGGLELVRDGLLDATYLYPTKGADVAALALEILTGKRYDRENNLQSTIVTQETADVSLLEIKDAEEQRANLGMLHQQVDSYMARYKIQKFLAIALGIGTLLLFIFVVTVYRSLIVKARLNRQLAQSNEKLKQLNEEIVQLTNSRLTFFTNISHELRTPLTLITDPVNRLLENHDIKQRDRSLLELIKRNAVALQQLVDAILDFRKIQKGKMELSPSPVELPTLLEQWVSDFEPTAERKQIHLHLDTSDFGRKPFVTDADKLARIVFNLMSNAVKYTPADGHVFVTLSRQDNGHAMISVRDTGKGINAEDRERVFARFFQSEGAAAGTGIGLAVVKSYAELLGGSARVVSEEGEGAELQVVIAEQQGGQASPAKQPAETTAWQATESNVRGEHLLYVNTAGRQAERVLIIDDNEDIRQYLVAILSEYYTVLEAADGQQGLEVATREVPDIVLCDVMMPVMDGMEFCKQMKAQTATSHIPIILLTAKHLEEQRAEGYACGADSYITKPFDSKTLLMRVDNLIKQRDKLRTYYTSDPKTLLKAKQAKGMSERDRLFLEKLQRLLRQHLSDSDFNVEAFGQEIGLSRVQLYRKVKALTGSTVVDLLKQARLHKARELLTTTDKSISEVSYEVGFTAPSYFSKCFREEYGITPTELIAKR